MSLATLERARKLGTLNKDDRTPQYDGAESAKPEKLLEAVNVQGNHIRKLQKSAGEIQQQVFNLKLRNAIVVAIITAGLTRAPEILGILTRLFR